MQTQGEPSSEAGRDHRLRARRIGRGRRRATSACSDFVSRAGQLDSWLEAHGEVPLPPYITRAGWRGRSSATRPCTRSTRAPSPRPRRAFISTKQRSQRLRDAGVETRLPHAARRRRHVPAGRERRPRRSIGCTASRSRSRRRPRTRSRRRARAAAASSRSARPRCARSNRPPATTAACRTGSARNVALHHARLPLPRRRRAPHELPPAALDAADAGERVRGLRDDPRRLRARDPRALPLLQLRRRDAAATRTAGGSTDAIRSPCHRRARARRAPAHARARRRRDAGVHAGRHVRHGQGDGAGRARASSARRSSSATRSTCGCGRARR